MNKHFSRKKALSTLMFTAGAAAISTGAFAVTPYPAITNFEADNDIWDPTDNDPLNDPSLAGAPPGAGAAHPGGPPDFITGSDWFDNRDGSEGVIEEVPSGFNSLTPPDGSAHLGILQFQSFTNPYGPGTIGYGPFNRGGRQKSVHLATPFSAQMDLWLNPDASLANVGSGIPDFWWTNGIGGTTTPNNPYDPYDTTFGGYISESGFAPVVNADGDWEIRTTASALVYTAEAGQWVTLEVKPIDDGTDHVDFVHNVWNADHTVLLGSLQVNSFGNPTYSEVSGPRYNWFLNGASALGEFSLFVDNVGWGSPIVQVEVPEPASLVLLGAGAALMLRRRQGRARS